MTKPELINWIRRQLGYPMVRVELHTSQIEDCIDAARIEYIKWGDSINDEVSFTIQLSAGVNEYDLPSGVTEIIKIKELDTTSTGINTLFSVENFLYNQGVLTFLNNIGNFSMIDYHLSLEFMDLLDKYFPDYYNWRYLKEKNKLYISPTPVESSSVGYILIQSTMLVGTNAQSTTIPAETMNFIYDKGWIRKYSLACAKEILGLIRRKFASFNSIGNSGISLDGDSLISEGKADKESLMEDLKGGTESQDGWPIFVF